MTTHVLEFSLNEKELDESVLNTVKQLFSGKDILLSIIEKIEIDTAADTSSGPVSNNNIPADVKALVNLDKGSPLTKGAGGRQPRRIILEF